MTKGEREIGGGEEQKKLPCHYIFDLTVDHTSAYNLQVGSVDRIPLGAKNIRPIFEGSVVKEIYNLADSKHPRPVRLIHTHDVPNGNVSGFGFRWVSTREENIKGFDALVFRMRHPIVRD